MNTVSERVQAGLDWLAEHGAEYGADLDRVDLDVLNVNDVTLCVLGQAVPAPEEYDTGYYAVVDHLEDTGQVYSSLEWAREHGFAPVWMMGPDGHRTGTDNEALTAEWKRRLSVARS